MEPLGDEDFRNSVKKKVKQMEWQDRVGLGLLGVVGIIVPWLAHLPLSSTITLVTDLMTSPLLELGDGFVSLIFCPIYNVAAIMMVVARLMWSYWRRLFRVTYA